MSFGGAGFGQAAFGASAESAAATGLHEAAGAVASAVSVSASATVIRAAQGASSTDVTVSGGATTTKQAAGAVEADVEVAASAASTKTASGAISAEVEVSGAAGFIKEAAGAVASAVTVAATGEHLKGATGAVEAAVTVTASAAVIRAASGSIGAEVTYTGAVYRMLWGASGAISTSVEVAHYDEPPQASITLSVANRVAASATVFTPRLVVTERPVVVIDNMCSNWITTDDLTYDVSGLDANTVQELLETAVEWLNDATCSQFAGSCLYEVRLSPRCQHGPGICSDQCDWDRIDLTKFVPAPVTSLVQVSIAGEVVPEDDYRLDNRRYLVPTTGGQLVPWPSQDMNKATDTEGTWKVQLYAGTEPPRPLIHAAKELTAQLLRRFETGDCDLPDNTTSVTRDGVTISMQTRQEGKIGLPTVDHAIEQYGCKQRRRMADPSGRRARIARIV